MIGNLAGLGVSVPGGYATTAEAFKDFIAHNDLSKRIFDKLATLDVEDVNALTAAGKGNPQLGNRCAAAARSWTRTSAPPTPS
jgi:phosphoenolpyruvate synthase/pyruvate phosphate dikinase